MTRAVLLDASVQLDGKSYRLARPSERKEALVFGNEDEPPWEGGVPALVSDPQFTWHLGAFKSRQGIPGTREYGKNTDGRWAFQLMPSAKINDFTLTSSSGPVLSIFEALGVVWALTAKRIYRINPSTNAVTLSNDAAVAGGFNYVMGMRWETDAPLVTLDVANPIIRLAALGAPDTWTQSAAVIAYRLSAGINRLFRVNRTGELRNVSTGLDPMTEANWADQVQVGDTSTLPTALQAYERTVFVGKPEGMFGVGDDGFGLPLIRRMARETDNCSGMALFDPYVMVPHKRGLYRYTPNLVEGAGIERELMNESPVKGRWKAFAADGDWLYGALAVGSETYILAGKERRGEPGFPGTPFLWDTLLHFSGACQAMWVSALSTNPRLYFGKGNNISYIELTDGPGSVEYATSGSSFSYRHRFDDRRNKDFQKVEAEGDDVDANTYYALYYSIDGGAFLNLDRDGNAMRVNVEGLNTFFLPSTAVGRDIQIEWRYVGASASAPGKLRYYEVFALPQSRKVRVAVMHFLLEEDLMHGREREMRAPLTQLNDLQALSESATPVLTTGPWGESVYGQVRRVRTLETAQEGDSPPSFVVEVGVQLRETT